jgi:hypothetical protein
MIEYTVRVFKNRVEWRKEGKRHREDGPAIEYSSGDKEWYKEGKLHREDGPAVEYINGYEEWFIEGERHREDGPAIKCCDGDKKWFIKGKLHREDGPAIECGNGPDSSIYKEWWIEGFEYTEKQFNKKVNTKTIVIDGEEISISLESFEALKKSLSS